jgi:endonuclease YncB( thermonuclease family)
MLRSAALLRAIPVALALLTASCSPDTAKAEQSVDTITCKVLWVHDGDTFRCEGFKRSTRLYGIDAPEMPGACREGRQCVEGDPTASRDYLAGLIGDEPLVCTLTEYDRYERPVMRCAARGVDLSCAMVDSGHAVERYRRLGC